jgi:hypothetical protein
MRKKPEYESRSNEARKQRRLNRSAGKKGAKSSRNETSDARDEKNLEVGEGQDSEQEMTPEEILRDLVNSRDPRVKIPALRLMHHIGKLVQPSEAIVACTCQRVRKPWPFSDGLGNGDPVEASRRYQMMITGEYDIPQSMESLHAEATYLSIMPELAIALVAKHKAEAAKKPETPLPPPPRPAVEVLRPAGLPLPEDVPHGVKRADVEDAEIIPGPSAEDIAEDERLRGADYGRPRVVT